jgi:hypothetical protein
MSAPDASWQALISGKLAYLPVPTMRRDRKERPATIIRSLELHYCEAVLPATDERDHLELVAIRNERVPEIRTAQDPAVPFHRDAARIQTEVLEESLDRNARGELARLAVENDMDYFFPSFLLAAR